MGSVACKRARSREVIAPGRLTLAGPAGFPPTFRHPLGALCRRACDARPRGPAERYAFLGLGLAHSF